jgi:uncharacterized protein HemX
MNKPTKLLVVAIVTTATLGTGVAASTKTTAFAQTTEPNATQQLEATKQLAEQFTEMFDNFQEANKEVLDAAAVALNCKPENLCSLFFMGDGVLRTQILCMRQGDYDCIDIDYIPLSNLTGLN